MKYEFIRTHEYLFPIEKICRALKVASSGYFKWKSRPKSNRLLLKEKIKEEINSIYFASKQRYGSPRITFELLARGYRVSRVTVAKYMRDLGLRSRLARKFKATTDSKHGYLLVGNVLDRNFSVTGTSKAWVSDITYIRTTEGFLYLTTVIDLYDRKVIGWSLSSGMSAEKTSLPAWRMAVRSRKFEKGLVFHSDRGVQYASARFAKTVESYGVIRAV